MKKRFAFIALLLIVSIFTLSACDIVAQIPGIGDGNQGQTPDGGETPDLARVT